MESERRGRGSTYVHSHLSPACTVGSKRVVEEIFAVKASGYNKGCNVLVAGRGCVKKSKKGNRWRMSESKSITIFTNAPSVIFTARDLVSCQVENPMVGERRER